MPAYGRHHTSQIVQIDNYHMMIDCGEATQHQIQKYKYNLNKINKVFISHLHGDHYLGLMGVIYSMHLSGRKKDLTIFGQRGLDEIILTQLRYSNSTLNFNLHFSELDPHRISVIDENELFTVTSFPLKHRLPCCGFLFREKAKPRRIKKDLIPKKFPIENFQKLKKGQDILDDQGNILFKNTHLTLPPKASRSYAFCSDTCYDENIVPVVRQVDLLYHEATFLQERKAWADATMHSTTLDAANIARLANVKKLMIGHFSARYRDITPLVDETKSTFLNTIPAIEGETIVMKEQ